MDMLTEKDIVEECKRFNKTAQVVLYKKYAGKMNGVCQRYVGSYDEACDIVQEAFIKIFSVIRDYKGEGSLEGWIRRIVVNMSLDYLKKKKSRLFTSIDDMNQQQEAEISSGEETVWVEAEVEEADYTLEELMELVGRLPEIYRVIFNMHCLEHYSHKEISEMLNIREETSRSRLRMARILLKEYLENMTRTKTTHIHLPGKFKAS